MNLKEELGKLEREETEEGEEELRLNAIQEDIYRLYRRIGVIVDYIDKGEEEKGEPLTEEEMWECGFDAGFEEGEKRAMKIAKEPGKEVADKELEKEPEKSSGLGKRIGDV